MVPHVEGLSSLLAVAISKTPASTPGEQVDPHLFRSYSSVASAQLELEQIFYQETAPFFSICPTSTWRRNDASQSQGRWAPAATEWRARERVTTHLLAGWLAPYHLLLPHDRLRDLGLGHGAPLSNKVTHGVQ